MNEDMRSLFEETIKKEVADLKNLQQGSKEREAAVKEIEALTKALNEDLKVQQAAWDNEENRRIAEEAKAAENDIKAQQVKNDKRRSFIDFAKGIGAAVVAGCFGLLGIHYSYRYIYKMEADGYIPNRDAKSLIPRIKFW